MVAKGVLLRGFSVEIVRPPGLSPDGKKRRSGLRKEIYGPTKEDEMLWEKACQRCKGDLFAGNDEFGPYIKCAQCGGEVTAEQEMQLRDAAYTSAAS